MSVSRGQSLEHMLILRAMPAFAGLDEAALSAVARRVRERVVPAGELLIREGEPLHRAVVAIEGRLSVTQGGQPVRGSQRRPGMGVVGMLADFRAVRSVVAQERSRVLELDVDALLDVMEEDFTVLAHLLRALADRIIDTYCALDVDFRAPVKDRPVPPHLQITHRELDLVERVLAVRQVPAFGRSSLDSVLRYVKSLEQRRFSAGQPLWAEGEPCHTYLHIVQGAIIGERAAGQGVLRYGPPSMPGLFGVLSGRERRWFSATAETDGLLLRVDREVILDLLEDDFEMATRCLKLSARRLIGLLTLRDEREAAGG